MKRRNPRSMRQRFQRAETVLLRRVRFYSKAKAEHYARVLVDRICAKKPK